MMEIRVCPECRSVFPILAEACPQHGPTLVDVRGVHPMLGQWIADRFLLLELLGRGGMGDVFVAWQASMHRRVALKVVNQDVAVRQGVMERFKREAHLTAQLRSPHTVAIFDYGALPNGMQYFAMEYIPGKTLSEILVNEGAISVEAACTVLHQVCLSLEEAHDIGIVHRDLKPGNIMITTQGKGRLAAKVLDFGIAKVMGPGVQALTETGTAVGTPIYMSPEQARGQQVTAATDVYALGLVAFEMVTGMKAFDGQSLSEIVAKHLEVPAPALLEVAPQLYSQLALGLDGIIRKCLAKRPEERFANGGELRLAVERLVAMQASGAHTAQKPTQATEMMPAAALMRGLSRTDISAMDGPSMGPSAAHQPTPARTPAMAHAAAYTPAVGQAAQPAQPHVPPQAYPVSPVPSGAVGHMQGQQGYAAAGSRAAAYTPAQGVGTEYAATATPALPQTSPTWATTGQAVGHAPARAATPSRTLIISLSIGAIILAVLGLVAGKFMFGSKEEGKGQEQKEVAAATVPKTEVPSVVELKPGAAGVAQPVVDSTEKEKGGAAVVEGGTAAESPKGPDKVAVGDGASAGSGAAALDAKAGDAKQPEPKPILDWKPAERDKPSGGGAQGGAVVAPQLKLEIPAPQVPSGQGASQGQPTQAGEKAPTVPVEPGVKTPPKPVDAACATAQDAAKQAGTTVRGAATCESARRLMLAANAACAKDVPQAGVLKELNASIEKACLEAAVQSCSTASAEYVAAVANAGGNKKPDCSKLKGLRREAEEKCSVKAGVPDDSRAKLAPTSAALEKLCKSEPVKVPVVEQGKGMSAQQCGDCLERWGWAKADATILWGDKCKKLLAPYLKGGSQYNACKSCPAYVEAIKNPPVCPKEEPKTGW